MLAPLLVLLLPLTPGTVPPVEPPGVRLSGHLAPYRSEPFPPDWVRLETHRLADPDCRRYAYEAYAGEGHWLVRYVMIPEAREEFRDIEQVFLVPAVRDPRKIQRVSPAELGIEATAVRWRGRILTLVDRRDLIRVD